MPTPSYINIEYFFYKTFVYLKQIYFFIINLPWLTYVFWARIVAAVLIVLFAVGIIYNLIGIHRAKKKKTEAL